MKETYRKKVFVSHIGLDAALALAFKKWIELVFADKCAVFVSGSFTDIEPGAVWSRKLREALNTSQLLLVICTRKSINSGWVLFEAGSIWAREAPILPICCDSPLELPAPLSEYQSLQFSEPQFSKNLIERLAKKLKLPPGKPAYNKMTSALRTAYDSARLDADVIDRIKQVKIDKNLKKTERTASRLAAHFPGVEIAEMKKRIAALTQKGYLKPTPNKLIGDFYSLTPKSERLLL